jgi:hypothetical protein
MKRLVLTTLATGALAAAAFAGTESYSGKEMKQAVTQPACPEWYSDNEFNVSLWGAYAFTSTDYNRESILDMYENTYASEAPGRYDRFLGGDHAWGGGLDAKYFWHRYFGFGLEGFGLDAHEGEYHFTNFGEALPPGSGVANYSRGTEHHVVGGVLGTFTLRYPIKCTRFAPYVWAGGGGIFGGENQRPVKGVYPNGGGVYVDDIRHDDESRGMGQFGGGMEIRITPHIGWIADFSWNVVDGPNNNFGMARTGINFAF